VSGLGSRRSGRHNGAIRARRGFTIVEALVAVMLLAAGLLALAGTSASVSRLIGEGRRSSRAGALAFQRLESLRTTACLARSSGSDSVMNASGKTLSKNTWSYVDLGKSTYRIQLVVTYPARAGVTRADTLDQEVSCIR
jgi:type II secretory pathway pseudopilin PulG